MRTPLLVFKMDSKKLSIEEASNLVLGNVMAVSPEFHVKMLDKIAELTGREVNKEFVQEVLEYLMTLECDWD